MDTTRRRLILSGTIAFPVSLAFGKLGAVENGTRNLVLCLTDIDLQTPVDLLSDVLDSFLSRGLPVSCAVDFDTAGPQLTAAGQLIAQTANHEVGLFEVMASFNGSENIQRYFQMRDAGNLRESIEGYLATLPDDIAPFPVVSVFDQGPAAQLDVSSFRGAGFRNHLYVPPDAAPMETRFIGRQQMGLAGGVALDLMKADDWDAAQLDSRLQDDGDLLVAVSLAGIANLDQQDVLGRLTTLADWAAKESDSWHVFPTRPIDLLYQTSPQPAPCLAILLYGDDNTGALRALAQKLSENVIPFTVSEGDDWPEIAEYCPDLTLEPAETDCTLARSLDDPAGFHPSSITMLAPDIDGWMGVNADGRFQMPLLGAPKAGAADLLQTNPVTDSVLAIHPDSVATPLQRAAFVERLLALQREGHIRVFSVQGFANYLARPDPVHGHFLSTRKRMETDPQRAHVVLQGQRDLYLQDARLAWRFIERFTDAQTGLCAGTVAGGQTIRQNKTATMWDLGSQMQGTIAARDLGIIGTDEATARIEKALDNLATVTVEGLRLPPSIFSTSTGRPERDGFDICDTSRFLVALATTAKAGLITQEQADELFARWDIAATIRDGHPFNFTSGAWEDRLYSHCAQYIGRSLSPWDIPTASPYAANSKDGTTDAAIRLLYQAAFIGHLGTESVLLEAAELGPTPVSGILTRVLFNAQLSSYERTGVLKCASETPLNFAPWFTYQGMRLDRDEPEGWVIAARGNSASYQTDAFREKAEIISSKSAYLWAAMYPHTYSDRLVRFIRQKARVEGFGFVAGIFAQTQEPMENYSDVNTNGIILTAIAHMLKR